MITRMAAAGFLVLAVTVAASAQGTIPSPPAASSYLDAVGGLTLDAAVRQALDHEPSLRAVRARIDAAHGQETQAGLRPNPTVSFSQQQQPAGADNQTRVDVQWPLDLFRRTGRVAVATRETDVALAAAADAERRLAADVRIKYGTVAAAIRTLSVTETLLTALTRQRDLVAARVDEGAVPPLDRDMLRVEVQRLEADRWLQTGEIEQRSIELKRVLGLTADAPLRLRQSLDELVRTALAMPITADVARATSARPDVREAHTRVDVAAAEIDRARREGRPDVTLSGMYMRMNFGFDQVALTPSGTLAPIRDVFHYVAATAMVTVPLTNRNQGAIAAAQAQQTTAEAELEAATLSAGSEIAAARARDEHARRALDAYNEEVLGLARRNVDVVRQTYELGRGTLVDALAEQRRYLDVERAYTDVLRETFEAREVLRQALGDVR